MMKNKELPPNLTFEEFKYLADRKPILEGNWIYQLTTIFVDQNINKPYPKFEPDCSEQRLFLSYEDALNNIKEKKAAKAYCNWIFQKPVGGCICEHGGSWLVDAKGRVLDYSNTYTFQSGFNSSFFGRSKERQRFREGDIVEVVTEEEIYLAVVSSEVLSVERCWQIYNNCQKEVNELNIPFPYILDNTDDTLAVIDGPSFSCHEHISPLHVMKPSFEIPDEIKNDMKTWIEKAKEEEKFLKNF